MVGTRVAVASEICQTRPSNPAACPSVSYGERYSSRRGPSQRLGSRWVVARAYMLVGARSWFSNHMRDLSLVETHRQSYPLTVIKVLHTAVWALLAGCILVLPYAVFVEDYLLACELTIIVGCEVLILLLNRGRCPLTDFAAKFTPDRSDNFDVYLPNWLARHNKLILGTAFLLGELALLWRWLLA
jgi:hypothetical protein